MAKILIVDDEAKIREVIREYAEFNHYETGEAEDGMQAVNMPVTGAKVLDLSDVPDCYTVKVYDDGGAGDCTQYAKDGWLLIKAPFGSVLSLTGKFNLKYTDCTISFGFFSPA